MEVQLTEKEKVRGLGCGGRESIQFGHVEFERYVLSVVYESEVQVWSPDTELKIINI